MNSKFLPIGSVVLLKKATKRLMITGFCMTAKDDNNKMYDYSACLYPEGMINSEGTALFNHDQIEKIYFIGYQDNENDLFMERLKKTIEDNKDLEIIDA